MHLSFLCAAAFLCFTVLAGSENFGSAAGGGVAYWRCGPRDECVCLADSPMRSDGSSALCGDTVEAITAGLQRRGQEAPDLVTEEEKDGVTVKETLFHSFGGPEPHLAKQFNRNGSHDTTTVGSRSINGGKEKETVRRQEDVDSILTAAAGVEAEEREKASRIEQRLGDILGPQPTIDHRSLFTDSSESDNGNSGRRMETTDSPIKDGRRVHPGSGPCLVCSFNKTVSLTLFGNYEDLEALACLTDLKRLSLQKRPLDKIYEKTFDSFQDFRLQELQLTRSNVTAVMPGAFRAFRKSLVSLDLSENRLDLIDASSISELPLLRTINVSANRLQNVSFLSATFEFLNNLQILDLSRNAIESFSMAGLTTEISEADVGQSRESRTKISNPLEREIASYSTTHERNSTVNTFQDSTETLATNDRTATSDYKLRNLQMIDLSMNKLTHLPNFSFVDLVQLRELRLAHNTITDIESDAFVLSNRYFTMETVTHRVVKGNGEDTLDYYISSALCNWGWPNLQLVDLSYNNLSHIKDGALSGALCTVRRLILSNNRISQLPRYLVERLPYLEHIDLSHNELTWLDVGAFTNPSLVSIDLSHNRLRKIISMTFLYLPAVTRIDISHNGLVYLYKFAFYRLCSSGLSVTISLRSNQLQTDGVWKLMSTFQYLRDTNCQVKIDLSDNNVTRFLGDALDFVKDRLAVFDVQHFRHWSQVAIDLSGNQIHCDCALVDDFRAMAKIYDSLATNGSHALKISNLDSWQHLNCSKNSEDALQEDSTVGTYLQIADCDRRSFCFEPCSCIRDSEGFTYIVNCSDLQLGQLPSSWLDVMPASQALSRIKSFDLSGNNLTDVNASFFRQMPLLENIHLRNNDLTSFPLELLNLAGLRRLTLAANPLRCNCSEAQFQDHLRRFVYLIQDWHKLTCATEGPENEQRGISGSRGKPGTENKRQKRRHFQAGVGLDLCLQKDVFDRSLGLNSRIISAFTQRDQFLWVLVFAVCTSLLFLVIAIVSVRRLQKWLRRRTRKLRGHGRSKVSDTDRQDEAKLELLIYSDESQKTWVRTKLVTEIRCEFQANEISVIVKTLPSSAARFYRNFSVDMEYFKKGDVFRTTLIVLSNDWINRMAEHSCRFHLDDFVDFSSSNSAFVQTVLFVTSKDVNFSNVHELQCVVERFPCLNVDDPFFQSNLSQHLRRSFRLESQPSSTNSPLRLINGREYESVKNNLKKY